MIQKRHNNFYVQHYFLKKITPKKQAFFYLRNAYSIDI